MVKLGIMQPYIFPYSGYFQLMNLVDLYVVWDNIQYTKKGWINRNRMLLNGKPELFTVPLKKDSDYLDIVDRELSDSWPIESFKLLNKIKTAYHKAPMFNDVYPLIARCISYNDTNLFNFIVHSLHEVGDYLDITTPLITSSTIDIDHSLKSDKKVMAVCKALGADHYINPIGGVELYNKDEFKDNGLDLNFCKAKPIEYKQFNNGFVPWLSIMDCMMFNTRDQLQIMLKEYTLV